MIYNNQSSLRNLPMRYITGKETAINVLQSSLPNKMHLRIICSSNFGYRKITKTVSRIVDRRKKSAKNFKTRNNFTAIES